MTKELHHYIGSFGKRRALNSGMASEEALGDHLNKRNSCPIFKKQNKCLHTSQIQLLLPRLADGKYTLGSAQKREGKKIVAGHIYLSIVEQLILLK